MLCLILCFLKLFFVFEKSQIYTCHDQHSSITESFAGHYNTSDAEKKERKRLKKELKKQALAEIVKRDDTEAKLEDKMETKSKLAEDIKTLALEKSRIYTCHDQHSSITESYADHNNTSDAEKKERKRLKRELKKQALEEVVKREDTEANLKGKMKTKFTLAEDIKNLVLEKSRIYTHNEQHSSITENYADHNNSSDAEKKEKKRLKRELKKQALAESITRDDTEAKLEGKTKTKSKLAKDIKALVLQKAQIYARSKQHSTATEDNTESNKILEAAKAMKREKMRVKRELKRQAKANSVAKSVKKEDSEAKLEGLNYLHLYSSAKDSWCFRKKQQTWLLNNAFNFENISDGDFQILLDYIIDLKGAARLRLMEESEKVIKAHEANSGSTNCDTASDVFERARSILQILV